MVRPGASAADGSEVRLEDPDLAQAQFRRLYDVAKIEIRRDSESRFTWEWRTTPSGHATIVQGHARAGEAAIAGIPSYYALIMAREGSVRVSSLKRRFEVKPCTAAAMVSADTEVDTLTRMGTRTLILRIEPSALMSHVAALAGTPVSAPPRFDALVDLSRGAGADVCRLARLLAEASERPDTPLGSPHVLAHLREALFGALVLGQESTIRHLLQRPPRAVNLRAVRRAEEILAARAAEPIAISELATLTGTSLRSLERSFKQARGCTLRDFLKSQRLELAHRRLRAAAPDTTVTQVLYASGFSHPGEFSAAYRRRFGEAPSETLRRARGLSENR